MSQKIQERRKHLVVQYKKKNAKFGESIFLILGIKIMLQFFINLTIFHFNSEWLAMLSRYPNRKTQEIRMIQICQLQEVVPMLQEETLYFRERKSQGKTNL